MPRVAVWFVRTALIYLALGFTLGAVLLAQKGLPVAGELWRLRPAHVEFLLIGWTAQLVLGVALWIFPRRRYASQPYGHEGLAWLGFGLLNLGVWLVAISPFVWSGHLLEIAAVGACAGNVWGRVRPGLSQM